MLGKTFSFLLVIIGLILIILGLSDFSFPSIQSVLTLGIGFALIGLVAMAHFSSEK